MIKFNYLNKNKLKKLGSVVLVTTMLGTSALTLSGCSKEVDTRQKKTYSTLDALITDYAVVVEDDIAIIYDELKSCVGTGHEEMWYCAHIDENFKIELPADTYVLESCTLDDAKEYAKGLISENGTVKTYDIEQEKTFVKVK
ncbi:MAG: hypothetical protein IJO32_02530 [Bacilli bacterium]|nr:hypothetical protein [Bacilli bacterium]